MILRRTLLTAFVSVAAVVLGGAAASMAATIHCVNVSYSGCTPHADIGTAVTAAAAGDVILVGPGTYNETVIVNKTLSFFGARAGVDARTRTGAESVVNATGVGSQNAGFIVTATDVVIDGFAIQGATDGASNGGGIDLKGGASPASGARILNNKIRNNAVGLYMNFEQAAPPSNIIIQRNFFQNNTVPAFGDGIFTSACRDVVISDNKFRGHVTAAIGINNSEDVTITRNRSNRDATFVIFTGTTKSSFVGNTGMNFTNSPPSLGNGQAAVAIGPNNSDLEISRNVLTDGARTGIHVTDIFGAAPGNVRLNVTHNTVTGMARSGIAVVADGLDDSTILGNVSSQNGDHGISLEAGNDDNLLSQNRATGNADFDCRDDSTGTGTLGTANTWVRNTATRPGKSSPNNLCRRN